LTLVNPSPGELLAAKPTALFCHNDWLALNCLRTLEKTGIKVPSEVSLLGVDDSPTFNALFPGLSTMTYPYAIIAKAAAAAMAGENISPSIPPLKMHPRETCATLSGNA